MGQASGPSGRDESHEERLDRELIEFLNELRVALPGVQVLFAFPLTIPFTGRFTKLSDGQHAVYFGTFCAAVVSTALLMAPTAYLTADVLFGTTGAAATGIAAAALLGGLWFVLPLTREIGDERRSGGD